MPTAHPEKKTKQNNNNNNNKISFSFAVHGGWMATSYFAAVYLHITRGSTVLGTPESVGMNGQIDWQAQQILHLVCSLAGQRCSEA